MNKKFNQESSIKDNTGILTHGLWGYYFKTNEFQHTLMIAPSTETNLFAVTDGLNKFQGLESETIGSVRFIGHVKAPESASYRFSTSEIKHTIIQINGSTVQRSDSEPIHISMNQNDICNIIIEYQMASNISPLTDHELLLYWQIDGGDKVLIPFQFLYQPDLSAKAGDHHFINAYPTISLFGTKAIDQDSDDDKISDDFEKNGYTVDPSTLKIIEWKDDYFDQGWPKYISNPFQANTAGDPYIDSEKVLNRMPSTDLIARDPLIAAFPAVGVILEKIIISNNEDLTNSKDYTTSTSKSWSVTGGASFTGGTSPEGPTGGLSVNFSGTYTSTSTTTSSTGSNVHINEAESGYINANIRYYNNGTCTIFDVTPTTSIIVEGSTIATVKAQPNEISSKLGYGEYYPDKGQHAISLNTMDQFSSKPIPINYQQFTAINEYHNPILLETDQVEGNVAKYNYDGSISYDSWTPYLATMNERTARIVIDYGEDQAEQRIAAKNLDDIYDNTPEITLKQALIKAFGVIENTADGTLSYKEKDITEYIVTIIYDQTTLDYMNKQMQNSHDYNIYNIILEPKMQFLIIIPDLIDYVVQNDDLFIGKFFEITEGGMNNSLAYSNNSEFTASLGFNDNSRGKLRENTRYLISGYIRIGQGKNEVTISSSEMYSTNIIDDEVITFNKDYNKFRFELNVFELYDLYDINFDIHFDPDTKYYLDNITCVPLEGETYGDNLLLNSQFEDEFNHWSLYVESRETYSEILVGMGPNKENVNHFTIGPVNWYVFSQNVSVKKNTLYVFSFDINMTKGDHVKMTTITEDNLTLSEKDLDYLKETGAIDKWHTLYTYFDSLYSDSVSIKLHGENVVNPIEFMATNFKLRELNPSRE